MTNVPTSPPNLPTVDVEADIPTSIQDNAEMSTQQRIGLTVPERFLLNLLLPVRGNRQQMRIAASVEQLIGFDEGEAIMFGIRHSEDGNLFFNETGYAAVGFDFSPEQVELIRQAVELADGEGRITREMLGLLDKIDSL